MTYMAFSDIKLDLRTTQRRAQRIQRVQFGDGYSQVLTDGLNQDSEVWECTTIPLTNEEAFSVESYLLSTKGQPITWSPPFDFGHHCKRYGG
jgi:phage-related protein